MSHDWKKLCIEFQGSIQILELSKQTYFRMRIHVLSLIMMIHFQILVTDFENSGICNTELPEVHKMLFYEKKLIDLLSSQISVNLLF